MTARPAPRSMTVKATCIAENQAERERLNRLASGLTRADLQREMPNGWTIATKLLHLAFWDYYALEMLKRWKGNGVTVSSVDMDAVNGAVREISSKIPEQAVIALVCSAAKAVDREVEGVGPELEKAIEDTGRSRILRRAIHRREHLDQIDRALGRELGGS